MGLGEQALCLACGSDPKNGTEKKMGAYVMTTLFQTSTVSSAMFITAMAANPLAVNLAADSLGKTISWGTWALAGLVPGVIALVAVPLILYILYPPEVKDTPDAPAKARCVKPLQHPSAPTQFYAAPPAG